MFDWLFGRKQTEPEPEASFEDYQTALEYVQSQNYSGLVRHYNVRGVQDAIQRRTGINVSREDAKMIVNTIRAKNGWGPAEYLDRPEEDS